MDFRLWLRQITYERLLIVHRRHLSAARRSVLREVVLPEGSSCALGQQLLAHSTPSQQLSQEELRRRVGQALLRLSEADQEVIVLRHFEALSNQEVAQVLDLSPDTASQRYGRALMRLREALLEQDWEGAAP
jgi:RNA polymerase sigma-70 factor (ECF subfamily)